MLQESKEKGGAANVLVVSSMTGRSPSWILGVYSMTKAALDNMVVSLAAELRADGIRVNGIAPGIIKTDMSAALWKKNDKKPSKRELIPAESLGLPEDIAGVAACICSKSDGAFMNGEVYHVDGGFGMAKL